MSQPRFSLTFHKIGARRFATPHPDYAVLFNDQKVGTLSYADVGYIGLLPDHNGEFHALPEAPLLAWETQRRAFIEAAEEAIAKAIADPRRIELVSDTLDPKVLRLSSGDDERCVSAKCLYFAQRIFGGTFTIPWAFCKEVEIAPLRSLSSADNIASVLVPHADKHPELETFLWDVALGCRPDLDDRIRRVIREALEDLAFKPELAILAGGLIAWLNDAYPETISGGMLRFLRDVQQANVWSSEKLSGASEHAALHPIALKIEDLVAVLRGVRTGPLWTKPLARAVSSDLPPEVRQGLLRILQCGAEMGKDSPVLAADPELVYIFSALTHPAPGTRTGG